MSSVRRRGRYRVVIYSNDHRPAHVHVIRGKKKKEAEAVFDLHCPFGPPEIREVRGNMTLKEANRIWDWLSEDIPFLCISWSIIHGDF